MFKYKGLLGHKSCKEKASKFYKMERNMKDGGETTNKMGRYAASPLLEIIKKKIIKIMMIGKIDLFENGRVQELR